MDLTWTLGLLLLLTCTVVRGSLSNVTCHTNSDCGVGFCCVSKAGRTLAEGSEFFNGPEQDGTCQRHVIPAHESCDHHSGCSCGPGLTCYRQVSGICCPPMTCLDSAYVQHQKEYWHHCLMSPTCGLPP